MSTGEDASQKRACEYVLRDEKGVKGAGRRCNEPEFASGKCELHFDMPDGKDNPEYQDLAAKKKEKIANKVADNDFNFEGARIPALDLSHANRIQRDVVAYDAVVDGDVCLDNVHIDRDVRFEGSTIEGKASLTKAMIGGRAIFEDAQISDDAWFEDAEIQSYVSFLNAEVGGYAWFEGATIHRDLSFKDAVIRGIVWFEGATIERDASFEGARIGGSSVYFGGATVKEGLNFEGAKFYHPIAQEMACRSARKSWEGLGDRDRADYYFYREMAAKRKQKKPDVKLAKALQTDKKGKPSAIGKHLRGYAAYWLEAPIQYVIGYWVSPVRVLSAFAVFVLGFGLIFWLVAQQLTAAALANSMWFSFLTLFNPIAGIANAGPGLYGALTVLAGFIGIFTWPVFIATLAKKYGR